MLTKNVKIKHSNALADKTTHFKVTFQTLLSFKQWPTDFISFVYISVDLFSSIAACSSLLDHTDAQAGSVGHSFISLSVFIL